MYQFRVTIQVVGVSFYENPLMCRCGVEKQDFN